MQGWILVEPGYRIQVQGWIFEPIFTIQYTGYKMDISRTSLKFTSAGLDINRTRIQDTATGLENSIKKYTSTGVGFSRTSSILI